MVHCASLQCHLRYDDEVYTEDYEEGYEAPEAGFGEGPPLLLAVASPSLEFSGFAPQICFSAAAAALLSLLMLLGSRGGLGVSLGWILQPCCTCDPGFRIQSCCALCEQMFCSVCSISHLLLDGFVEKSV